MKFTNKTNLPVAVFNALTHSTYDKGESDYSVTTLLRPPQIVQLERMFWDEIEEDAVDNVWRLLGQASHHVLETHAPSDQVTEERLYINILGRKIGGQTDNYHNGIITDYKVTSSYSVLYGSHDFDWMMQLNMYAKLFRDNGYPVHGLQIVCIFRDWDRNKAKQNKDYPQAPVSVIPIELLDDSEVTSFMVRSVNELVESEGLSPSDLFTHFPCSPHDTWQKEPTYACMKENAKRATRVFDNYDEASSFCEQNKLLLVERPGSCVRCEDYCSVSEFCLQNKYRNSDET